jgi:hypothetical protein
MDVDEQQGQLILTGEFGLDPGEVKVNGVALVIDRWDDEHIKAFIDRSGPASAGNVVVWSKGRKSNQRRLTDWRPTFHWDFITGSGTQKYIGELYLHFRGDVAPYREEIGKTPKFRMVPFTLASDSYGDLEASGREGDNEWRGTAVISNRIALGSQNLMDGNGEIDTESPDMRFAFFVVAISGMTNVNTVLGRTTPLAMAWAKDDGEVVKGGLPALHITLDAHFGLLGETKREVPPPDSSAVLYWTDEPPKYPPLPSQPALVAPPMAQSHRMRQAPAIARVMAARPGAPNERVLPVRSRRERQP